MLRGQVNHNKKPVILQKKTDRKCTQHNDDSFDRRYASAVKAYQNYMEGLHLVLKEKERRIFKILRKRSSPLWFQELTDEQCSTCDQLLDAIGDDLDERTIHRSKSILRMLGVFPICRDRILRTALILCNRNDISFLWILLELSYLRRSGKVGAREIDYTINERLLLTSIAHLDMITTLRGLDNILPPKKYPNLPLVPTHEEVNCKIASLKTCPRVSPYSKRMQVKTTGCTVPLKVQRHRDEFLGRYSRYRDPEYIVRNEQSRWFARCSGSGHNLFSCVDYSTSASKDRITESEVDSDPIDSANDVVKELLDEHIRNIIARVECCQILCPKHQQLEGSSTNLLQNLQRNSPACEALKELIRSQCAQWKEEELQSDGKRHIESLLKGLVDEAVSLAILKPVSSCPECWQRFDIQQKLLKGLECTCTPSEHSVKTLVEPPGTSKQTYFKFCNKASVPFEFNYAKIHDEDERQKGLLACPIKSAIRRALGVENAANNVDIDHAIDKIVRNMRHEEQSCPKEPKANKNLTKQPLTEAIDLLDMDHVDTKNVALLQKLLKLALRKLAERPMYILATFPDADKLPILAAWIRNRYGVPVDPQERATALLESKHFWDTLIPRATAIRWPSRMDTGFQNKVNWNYKMRLEEKARKLMYKFHRRFKNVQVQEGRLWWTSMVPYHAGVDRFRRTFSAYFPNCEPLVVPPVRPWRPHEYKKERNNRGRF